jgi:putative CocE/NonD family hydrolase
VPDLPVKLIPAKFRKAPNPRRVREIPNLWIGLSDGMRLAARVWMPEGAETHPVPAILECIPYRKRDGTVWRDEAMHPYIASHGYAVLRIDLRGSGDSDGILDDEYLPEEQTDLVEAIGWVAEQSWCNGHCGMTGISWGGFNALQVAARRPPALKAIITIDSTDDRYGDDVHYMGGAMLHDNFAWASAMFAYLSQPPDPLLVGEIWRETWLDRLQRARFWLRQWLQHQHRDAYWRQGSVCESYRDITCAVYAIGGWEDGYSNAVPRLLEGLEAPAKGLIGPWGHALPHAAYPGPRIGFLQECLRWWDHWLKGIDTGIMREPRYRVWMNESFRPAAFAESRAGRWVAEHGWPSPQIGTRSFHLTKAGLAEAAGDAATFSIQSPLTVGTCSLEWCSYGGQGGDLPTDQRGDDAGSLCFDSAPLADRLEILGAPVLDLAFSSDKPVATICVRLCDVWPDGASARVTFTLFNLTHHASHSAPEPLVPGKRYRARIPLNHIAHAFPPGHRLRLAISTSYWPMMWPAPERFTLTLQGADCRLDLPQRQPGDADAKLAAFPPAATAPGPHEESLRPDSTRRRVETDVAKGETTVTMVKDAGATRLLDIDLTVDSDTVETYRIRHDDPASAEGLTRYRHRLSRGDWRIETRTTTSLKLTATHFIASAELEAFEGTERIFCRNESFTLPRNLV